jgi:phosphate transport system substrate-binding protein
MPLRTIAIASLFATAFVSLWAQTTAMETANGYLLSDGSMRIIADASTRDVLEQLDRAFVRRHPERKFTLVLDRSGFLALSGITSGLSAFSPMPHTVSPLELRPFLQTYHRQPVDITIAHLSCSSDHGMPFPGLYANDSTPDFHLTWTQVGRLLTRGMKGGDLTRWEQIGVKGPWSNHAIHIYGPPDDGAFVSALRHESFDGNPLAFRYEELPSSASIAAAISKDVYGIGLIENWKGTVGPLGLRPVPISNNEVSVSSLGSAADLQRKLYPFARDIHFYIDKPSGGQVNPAVVEYVEFALSKEGQLAITRTPRLSSCRVVALRNSTTNDGLAKLH